MILPLSYSAFPVYEKQCTQSLFLTCFFPFSFQYSIHPFQMKGEIEAAQDSLHALESCDVTLHRTEKLYNQSCEQVVKLQGKLEKMKTDPNANLKAKLQVWLTSSGVYPYMYMLYIIP